MRNHVSCPLCIAFSAIALMAALTMQAQAQVQTHQFNTPSENDEGAVLKEVVRSPSGTVVRVDVTNRTNEEQWLCAYPAGSPLAFVLQDLDGGVELPLVKADGLPSCAEQRALLRPGQRKRVALVFASLPRGARHLQVSENRCKPSGADVSYWCFREIDLQAPPARRRLPSSR